MKFLCDQMLGTLAKWLRICGFDTYFANSEISDDELLEMAKKENRCLITRDKELTIRAKKRKLELIEINSTDLDEQLSCVLCNVTLDKTKILTRCTLCNSTLDEIKKEGAKSKVPEKIFENNEKFWLCPSCNKIYWVGTHYEKMLNKINSFNKT